MPASMVFNGNVTYETCPVCQEPEIKIEHGYTKEMGGGPAHHEACPNCGTSIVWVCYPCPQCATEQINQAELLPPVAKDVEDDAWVKGA